MVRSWDLSTTALRAALTAIGVEAELIRVDIEPALVAALSRRNVDAIVHAPATRGIPFVILQNVLRELAIDLPIVRYDESDNPADVAAQIATAVQSDAN